MLYINGVVAAKSLIYERFRSLDILENAADRRTTENRSDLMAICCDLIDDLFKLEENNIQVVCVASNWNVKSMSSSMDVRIKNSEKGNTKECPLISDRRSDQTDINDITAPQTVVKSNTYSDVVPRRERRTYRNQTDGSIIGPDFTKRTGNNGYPNMKDSSNKSGYRRRSGFMGKSSTGGLRAGPLPVRDFL